MTPAEQVVADVLARAGEVGLDRDELRRQLHEAVEMAWADLWASGAIAGPEAPGTARASAVFSLRADPAVREQSITDVRRALSASPHAFCQDLAELLAIAPQCSPEPEVAPCP